jgi:endonuclease YncB( thermonuclease family)
MLRRFLSKDPIKKAKKDLKPVLPANVDYFSFKGKTFYAKFCNVYDGDTFTAVFKYNGEIIKYRCRCDNYDSSEMRQPLNAKDRDKKKEMARNARERLVDLLSKHESQLIKIECGDFDKYGRILVIVYNMVDEDSINTIMVREG